MMVKLPSWFLAHHQERPVQLGRPSFQLISSSDIVLETRSGDRLDQCLVTRWRAKGMSGPWVCQTGESVSSNLGRSYERWQVTRVFLQAFLVSHAVGKTEEEHRYSLLHHPVCYRMHFMLRQAPTF